MLRTYADMQRSVLAIHIHSVKWQDVGNPTCDVPTRAIGNMHVDRQAPPRADQGTVAIELAAGVLIQAGCDTTPNLPRQAGASEAVRKVYLAELRDQRIQQHLTELLDRAVGLRFPRRVV